MKRTYKDHEGNKVTEYTDRGMRLRTTMIDGKRVFNYSDIETLQYYSAEEVFAFLYESMGDELLQYMDGGTA